MENAKQTQPYKVMLVDDDRLVLATLGSGLEQVGYAVQVCASADEARRILAIEAPDILVLDVRMPGDSGLDLSRELRDEFGIPFIFLTAYSEAEVVMQAAQHGALGYVVKPVDIAQLVPAIEAALARAADMKKLRQAGSQLQTALNESREVSVAVGLLMERRRLDRKQAFELLRTTARSQRRKIGEVAQEMIDAVELLNNSGS